MRSNLDKRAILLYFGCLTLILTVAKQTIKQLHFHLVFRCKTSVNLFCFVSLILHTGGGIVWVPVDMLEPIPSLGMSMK